MKKIVTLMALSTLLKMSIHLAVAQVPPPASDRVAIERVVKNFEEGWNQHDSHQIANQFQTNATWVNWLGVHSKGRAAIEKFYQTLHTAYYTEFNLKIDPIEDLTMIKPDVVVIHLRFNSTGDKRIPDKIQKFRVTMLLTKRGNEWRIMAGHMSQLKP